MKRFRSVIAGLLALLLIFPNLGLPGAGNSVYADGLGEQAQRKFQRVLF